MVDSRKDQGEEQQAKPAKRRSFIDWEPAFGWENRSGLVSFILFLRTIRRTRESEAKIARDKARRDE